MKELKYKQFGYPNGYWKIPELMKLNTPTKPKTK